MKEMLARHKGKLILSMLIIAHLQPRFQPYLLCSQKRFISGPSTFALHTRQKVYEVIIDGCLSIGVGNSDDCIADLE